MFVSFTQLFLDMGISVGILHYQDIKKEVYSSLYWLNIIMGVGLTALLFFISPLLTESYQSDDLDNVVRILCFSILLNSIGNQQRVVCQKKSNFKRLSIIEIISSIITLAIAISTAYMGYGVYSLAFSTITGLMFNNLSHFICGLIHDNKIAPHFKFSETFPFIKIGIYSMGSQILDFLSMELDIVIVSATLGLDFLGVYNIAKKLSLSVYRLVTPIILKVFTPLLAEIGHNREKLTNSYLTLSKMISLYIIPLFFLIATFSPTIMELMFGESFVEGAPVQSIFAVMCGFNSFMGVCGALQVATGRTDLGLAWTIFCIIVTATVFYTTSMFGVTCFLCGIVLRTLIEVVFIWVIQFRQMLKISFSEYLKVFDLPLIISMVLAAPCIMFFYYPNIVVTIIGSIFYITLYFIAIYNSSYKKILIETIGIIRH